MSNAYIAQHQMTDLFGWEIETNVERSSSDKFWNIISKSGL